EGFITDTAGLIGLLQNSGARKAVWDLIDVDAQGAELEMFRGNLEWFSAHARRLHISTHSRAIHKEILGTLRLLGWTVLMDFPCLSSPRVGALGKLVSMDGHMTVVPSQASEVWTPHF
ncbi:unnamed protein product, partial [Polarella glacialis]